MSVQFNYEKFIKQYEKFIKQCEEREKASLSRDNVLNDKITSILREQAASAQSSSLQNYKDILSHLYDKSTAYTNLVIMAGYAAIFAIWQLTKSHLTFPQESLVAILLIISILLFVGFELTKMISQSFFLRRLNFILETSFPEAERLQLWKIGFNHFDLKQRVIWIWFLIPTLITGFGAGLVLLFIFSLPYIAYFSSYLCSLIFSLLTFLKLNLLAARRKYYRRIADEKKRLHETGVNVELVRLLCRHLADPRCSHAKGRYMLYEAQGKLFRLPEKSP